MVQDHRIRQLTGRGESRSINVVADAGANTYPGEGIGFGYTCRVFTCMGSSGFPQLSQEKPLNWSITQSITWQYKEN